MAGKRFSRIIASAKYYAAVDNYIKYITDATKRSAKIGQGDPRKPSTKLYVIPFGLDLGTGKHVPSSAAKETWDKYKAQVGVGVKETGVTAANIVKYEDFQAARVIVTTGRSATGKVETSRVTGMKYLNYGGKSTSFPFGKAATDDQMVEKFTAIKAAILAGASQTSPPIVSMKAEKFS